MHVVVTGAAGFIGSHLCERLLQRGYLVTGVDNLLTGTRDNLERLVQSELFSFQERSVVEPPEVDARVDAVYHLASPASPAHYQRHPVETLEAGSIGTLNYLRLALRNGATFVLASTSEVYGDPLQHPQSEDYNGNVSPVGPRSMYDEAKRFSEAAAMSFHRRYGLGVRIARIFNTYGPRMRPDDGRVIPNFFCQALRGEPLTVYGDGSQTRSFCFVEDLVEALVRLPDCDYDGPVNIGNPAEHTVLEVAELVGAVLGVNVSITHRPLPQDDPKVRCPDIALARRLLDWEPTIGLQEGLAKTAEYFRKLLGRGRFD